MARWHRRPSATTPLRRACCSTRAAAAADTLPVHRVATTTRRALARELVCGTVGTMGGMQLLAAAAAAARAEDSEQSVGLTVLVAGASGRCGVGVMCTPKPAHTTVYTHAAAVETLRRLRCTHPINAHRETLSGWGFRTWVQLVGVFSRCAGVLD